jgi:NAD(P)H-hydrate repair Nnr-like enzyme with NAD(P)H-hydrate dehydratase domain
VTVVATPGGWTRSVQAGTPWLATAGTGDVLAGVLGALAAAATPTDADAFGPVAATGAWLHGAAGRLAAALHGGHGGPITALDVAEALPRIVAEGLAAD